MASGKITREIMDDFRRLVNVLRSSHRAAGNVNLTGAQLFVVSILAESEAPMSVRQLAERTQTDPSTVSVVAGRLVERGVIKRERSGDDARRAELSLTPRGRALSRKAPHTVAQKRLADALQKLSPAEAANLKRILHKLIRTMGADRAKVRMMFDDDREG